MVNDWQADLPPVTLDADDKLFEAVLRNPEHTLHSLLPERRHDNTTTKETWSHVKPWFILLNWLQFYY